MSVIPSLNASPNEPGDLIGSPGVQKLLQSLIAAWPDPIDTNADRQAKDGALSIDMALQLQDAGWILIESVDLRFADTVWLKDVALSAKGKALIADAAKAFSIHSGSDPHGLK